MQNTGGLGMAAAAGALSGPCREVNALAISLWQSLGADEALACIHSLAAASPRDGNLRAVEGRLLYVSGRREQAAAALAAAATLGSEIEVFDLLAKATFPGPGYHAHIRALHGWLRPATYLEIGVFDGDALALAQPGTRVIGVDPAPRPASRRAYAAETQIHTMTSDAYFAGLAAEHPDQSGAADIDLAFIDGLHLFEQVLQDFINVERHCHPGSVVVLHDTLPVAPAVAARQRHTSYWCGDVWKMLPCLRQYRPDLQLLTIPTCPSGLTLVRGLDRQSRVLSQNFRRAVAEYVDAPLPPPPCPRPSGATSPTTLTWSETGCSATDVRAAARKPAAPRLG